MEVFYKREMKHNYMIIKPESWEEGGYESRMLVGNVIEGLLRFRLKQMDQEIYFCYEITSKQPLSRLLEGYCLKAEDLRRFCLSLNAALDRMEVYLLKEEQILLKPEYIYVEPDTFLVSLCLVPGRKADFSGDLSRLLQFILGKIDHQDQEIVLMAYGLFQESQKENYSMEDLLKILLPKTPKSIPEKKRPVFQEPILEKEVLFEEFEETVAEKKENSRSKRKKLPSLVIAAGSLFGLYFFLGMDGIRSFGWVSALMGLGSAGINCWLDRKPRTKKKQGGGKEQRPDREQQKEVDQWKEIWGEELVEEPAPLQEEPIMEKNTVLLADLDVLDGRYRLVPLQQELPVIQLAYYPFVIGKQEPMADGIIPKETVSRLHARIDKTEAGFFLTDLNSTNGTMVNGRALEANETVSIQAGDQIYIADAGFLFSK